MDVQKLPGDLMAKLLDAGWTVEWRRDEFWAIAVDGSKFPIVQDPNDHRWYRVEQGERIPLDVEPTTTPDGTGR